MAYTANEYRIQVRGTTGQYEEWNNTWTVLDLDGTQDVQDAADLLRTFYDTLALETVGWSNTWYTVGAVAKNLGDSTSQNLAWIGTQGQSSADMLPTQCAVRVSLNGTGTAQGGPFLTGFTVAAADGGGFVDSAISTAIKDALETFTAALTTADWSLRLDRPTVGSTVQVISGRVGQRFDVIRKRSNDSPESYLGFSVS